MLLLDISILVAFAILIYINHREGVKMIESMERLDDYYYTKQLEQKANDPYYTPESVDEMVLLRKHKKRLIPVRLCSDINTIGESDAKEVKN